MGIAGTLYEKVFYDETGQNLSGSLADYLVPTACEIPPIEIVPMHTPNRRTPAGIKGMAEGGVMGRDRRRLQCGQRCAGPCRPARRSATPSIRRRSAPCCATHRSNRRSDIAACCPCGRPVRRRTSLRCAPIRPTRPREATGPLPATRLEPAPVPAAEAPRPPRGPAAGSGGRRRRSSGEPAGCAPRSGPVRPRRPGLISGSGSAGRAGGRGGGSARRRAAAGRVGPSFSTTPSRSACRESSSGTRST